MDVEKGIDLKYFENEEGFTRAMAREAEWLTQIDGTLGSVAEYRAAFPRVRGVMLPEGTKIEFVENPAVNTPVSNHHVHFATDRIDDMQAWYVKTFGAKAGSRGAFKAADLPGPDAKT